MEIFDLKLPNGETLEYIDTNETDLEEYLLEMDYDITKIEQFYLAYVDIKERELNQIVVGEMISVTKEDAVGMLQVQAALGLGLPSTDFAFDNGNIVTMTPANFAAFAGAFSVARSQILIEKHINRASIAI